MKFKFGIESVELSINKEEIKTPELAVESISDIDLNSMSLDCMNALAGFESAVLEVANLYNMQEIVGSEAEGEGLSARIKNAVARAVKALWNWMKKVFNFIYGLFRKNKTTETLVAEVVVANEVPKIFKEASEEMKKASENTVEDLVKTKNDVAASIAERHKNLREMINNIGKNTDKKISDSIDKSIKENEKLISEIVDEKVDKVAKAAVEEVSKNPENTSFTYSLDIPVFEENATEDDKLDIIFINHDLSKGANGGEEFKLNTTEGIMQLLKVFVEIRKIFYDTTLDKYVKHLKDGSITYEEVQELNEISTKITEIFPKYTMKKFELEFDLSGDIIDDFKYIRDIINKHVPDALFMSYQMEEIVRYTNSILIKSDTEFNFVNDIKDQDEAKKVMLLVKTTKTFLTMFNKESVGLVKLYNQLYDGIYDIRSKTNR